ncbi:MULTISPECIES: hypothetical protein [unclassified Nocardioides]|uniref:hypothetical protein n=1 Tax=unclassified Nocardioides TaxID=2615069 RepID=UPI0006F7A135|nr:MULTISPECIES: hypothetical protein [unclassified Nocardioides]KRA32332.1 hypothetical protein ASD81_12160 [Nocardioides sp. Root614]KRA88984.1 hypothetical protein ASD84_12425 [Nocardioides sp. Root682]
MPGLVLAATVVAVPAQAGAEAPPGSAPVAAAAKGQKVVVCKYVRKPNAAEVFSHIVVVSENALEGKGFAGAFPFAFSDAHFKSVAVRYATKGEQAHQISRSVCPADVPPGEEPPGEQPPGQVGGISEEQPPAGARGADEALPRTGPPAHLLLLAALGGLCSLAGAWLVAGPRRGGRPSK